MKRCDLTGVTRQSNRAKRKGSRSLTDLVKQLGKSRISREKDMNADESYRVTNQNGSLHLLIVTGQSLWAVRRAHKGF